MVKYPVFLCTVVNERKLYYFGKPDLNIPEPDLIVYPTHLIKAAHKPFSLFLVIPTKIYFWVFTCPMYSISRGIVGGLINNKGGIVLLIQGSNAGASSAYIQL